MHRTRGFTLIEVMIVVAVIAILAAVAYPSYERYAMRAKRSEAQQLMLAISSKQAQYILDARSYTSTIGTGGLNISREGWTCAASSCGNGAYTVAIVVDNAATPPTFTITATPAGSQAIDGTMTLDSVGSKTRTVEGTNVGW